MFVATISCCDIKSSSLLRITLSQLSEKNYHLSRIWFLVLCFHPKWKPVNKALETLTVTSLTLTEKTLDKINECCVVMLTKQKNLSSKCRLVNKHPIENFQDTSIMGSELYPAHLLKSTRQFWTRKTTLQFKPVSSRIIKNTKNTSGFRLL